MSSASGGGSDRRHHDLSTALDALHAIDPAIGRQEWLRVALVAKAAGLSENDFSAWSAAAGNYGGERDCRGAWVAEPTDVGPGSLYYIARQHGWVPPAPQRVNGHAHGKREFDAAEIWDLCEPATPGHGYIARKGGTADGLRVYPPQAAPLVIAGADVRGWLVVPVYSLMTGDLATLQFIAPDGPRKLNLPRYPVKGSFVVGELAAGPAYLVEGIGQAWACWRASGRAAICTFGAGRMVEVAKDVATAHPQAGLVVVADRGKEREAQAVAGSVGGGWVAMPESAAANYDANDYLAEHGAEALGELLEVPRVVGKRIVQPDQRSDEQPKTEPLPFLTIAQLRAASAHISWAVKHILPADSVGVMFGASGTFKSFVALDLALHVAHGMRWLGRKTGKGPVLYIAAEGGTGIWRRVQAWHTLRHIPIKDDLPFYVVPVAVPLATNAADVVLAAQSAGVVPSLVIVDTMSQTNPGEENSATETSRYFRELGSWFRASWSCAVLVIHHTGHSTTERPRGSSSIVSNSDFLFGVFRDEKDLICTVECVKQKDGDLFEPVMFELASQVVGVDDDGEEVRSLAARQLSDATAMQDALAENKRRGRPPGGLATFLNVVQSGAAWTAVRLAFYGELGGDKSTEAKERAWRRAVAQAKAMGFVEIANGEFLVLKEKNSV